MLPRFEDGRINYTGSPLSAVVIVVVRHIDKFLILKRSQRVANYKGMWDFLAGYFDKLVSASDIASNELIEELGITGGFTLSELEPLMQTDGKIDKSWLVFPVLAELDATPQIKLNWENERYEWIYGKELAKYETVPGARELFLAFFAEYTK